MKRKGLIHAVAVGLGLLVGSTAALAETFNITIENLSQNVLTPAVFISHDGGFDLFDAGGPASPELEALAEDGMTGGVEGLAAADLGGAVADYGVAGGAPIGPGGSASVSIDADPAHSRLTFASMLAFSNDAFIGGTSGDGMIDLFPGGSAFNGAVTLMPDDVWDAGTELNDELAANVPALGGAGSVDQFGTILRPHAGITGGGNIPIDRDWTGGAVALITITPEPASAALLALAALFGLRRIR